MLFVDNIWHFLFLFYECHSNFQNDYFEFIHLKCVFLISGRILKETGLFRNSSQNFHEKYRKFKSKRIDLLPCHR